MVTIGLICCEEVEGETEKRVIKLWRRSYMYLESISHNIRKQLSDVMQSNPRMYNENRASTTGTRPVRLAPFSPAIVEKEIYLILVS